MRRVETLQGHAEPRNSYRSESTWHLDPRLSGNAQPTDRRQDPPGRRLSGHTRDHVGNREERSAGPVRLQLVEPEGAAPGLDQVRSFIRVVVQEHDKGNPEINRMGVPLAVEFATSAENRRIMELVYSSQTFGRPYMLIARGAGGAGRGAARAFWRPCSDPEPDVRCRADRARHRSDLGRGAAGARRQDLCHSSGFGRKDKAGAGPTRRRSWFA